jgi:chromosome segregation ATPase
MSNQRIDPSTEAYLRVMQERNEAQAALSRQEQTIRELNHDTRKAEDECDRLREALLYIAGYDVAGYPPHMPADEVARQAVSP